MRPVLVMLSLLVLAGGFLLGTSSVGRADPYRWCAEYGGGKGGGTNCGFVTWEQCMETVSGIGGFCRQNQFYDGIPFGGEPARTPKRKRR
jgi:hypothetical protein